jgi:hypothetical protein
MRECAGKAKGRQWFYLCVHCFLVILGGMNFWRKLVFLGGNISLMDIKWRSSLTDVGLDILNGNKF